MERHQMHEKDAELNLRGFYETKCKAFYRDLFPVGSFERAGHQEDKLPNGLALTINVRRRSLRAGVMYGEKTIITDELEQLQTLRRRSFVVISPISYFGYSRKASNASLIYALALDIDYVGVEELVHMLDTRFDDTPGYGAIPTPTYLVNSGHGVHLYYVFDKPLPMYPKNQRELLRLKQFLIDYTWDKYTSYKPERKECLGLVQGFRMVGGQSKVQGERVRAYKIGSRCSVKWLESFDRGETLNLDIKECDGLTLEEARELYPEWYERRVVRGEKLGVPNWRPKRDLYDWWKRKCKEEIQYGHRYFGIMVLAIYAIKCGIEREELERDAFELQQIITERGDRPFTVEDTVAALQAYNEDYRMFPRAAIERVTGLSIPPNKRNGRPQAQHVKIMSATRDILYPNGEWRKGSGRKPKKLEIRDYARKHPNASNSEIARALGVSRPTVIKWLKGTAAYERKKNKGTDT